MTTSLELVTVAHIRDIYPQLSETFIYQYISHLQRYRPVVLTRRQLSSKDFEIKSVFSAAQGRDDTVLWRIWHEIWRLGATQVGIVPNSYDMGRNYFAEVCRKQNVQILHAHFGPEGVRSLPLKRILKVPLVTTFYGYDMSILPRRRMWKHNYSRLFQEGDRFLAEGTRMRDVLVSLGCPLDKVRIVHISIDPSKILCSARKLPDNGVVNILFCGRFTEKKGLLYALDAFRKVLREGAPVKFRIIGDGPQRDEVEKYINEHDLHNSVTLLGFQPYSVFLKELQESHIFIQPSVTAKNGDTEGGAPTTLVEAQASGIPVLATQHADIPEVVVDGVTGYLVKERDVDALAQRLHELVTHPDLWPIMGAAGRSHIERHYDIKQETEVMSQIYDELL